MSEVWNSANNILTLRGIKLSTKPPSELTVEYLADFTSKVLKISLWAFVKGHQKPAQNQARTRILKYFHFPFWWFILFLAKNFTKFPITFEVKLEKHGQNDQRYYTHSSNIPVQRILMTGVGLCQVWEFCPWFCPHIFTHLTKELQEIPPYRLDSKVWHASYSEWQILEPKNSRQATIRPNIIR